MELTTQRFAMTAAARPPEDVIREVLVLAPVYEGVLPARAALAALDTLTAQRDEAREANHRLVRINGGLRGKASDGPDDHFCAVEGCQNEPTMYEFASDEFVCDEHVYYGAENPMEGELRAAEAALACAQERGQNLVDALGMEREMRADVEAALARAREALREVTDVGDIAAVRVARAALDAEDEQPAA